MTLRIVLIAAGIVAILLGLLFLLAPDMAIQSFQLGASDVPSRLFARVFGGTLMSLGVVNILASGDGRSNALSAIVVGNILGHLFGIGVDFTETFPKTGGWWLGLAIHLVFIAAFGYYLLNWNKEKA
jgi:uncharacterized protein YjeT (DUF2065 family)